MKKAILSLFIVLVTVLSTTLAPVSASQEYRITRAQLKDYSGRTAVVTENTRLIDAYTLTHSSGAGFTDILMPLNFVYSIQKGNIVLVMEETGSQYRVRIPALGDAQIITGFIEKRYVSFDKGLISNANQCIFSNVRGTNSQTNAVQTISGRSQIHERSGGRLLVSAPGGAGRFWIQERDASYNFDMTVTDITLEAYRSLVGTRPPQQQRVELRVTMNQLAYTVNGQPMRFDVAPYLDTRENRSMIPLRFIAEAFGATVTWDDRTKTQTIRLDGKTFTLTQNVPLPGGMGTPVLRQDRFFAPLRYVSQELGATVEWDGATQTNTIVYYK